MIKFFVLFFISFSAFASLTKIEFKSEKEKIFFTSFFHQNELMRQCLLENKEMQKDFPCIQKNIAEFEKIIASDQDKDKAPLQETIELMKTSPSLSALNRHYYHLAKQLLPTLRAYKLDLPYEEYFCGMFQKGWIQDTSESEEVQNPYSPKKPNCGAKKQF